MQGADHISLHQVVAILWAHGIQARYHGSAIVYGVEVERSLVAESQDLLERDAVWGELSQRISLTGRPHPEVDKTDISARLGRVKPIVEKRTVLDAIRNLGPEWSLVSHVLKDDIWDAALLKDGLLTIATIPRGSIRSGSATIDGLEVLVVLESQDGRDSDKWVGQIYREDGEVMVVPTYGSTGHRKR